MLHEVEQCHTVIQVNSRLQAGRSVGGKFDWLQLRLLPPSRQPLSKRLLDQGCEGGLRFERKLLGFNK
jgi:hypothetical protein